MKTKLTLSAIKRAEPKAARYVVWDSDVKGFGLRVNTDGTKTYVLKYLFHGRQRWFTIGKHGSPFTPDTARTEAQKLLGQAKGKVDPVEVRRIERTAGLTLSEVCDTYFKAMEAGEILTRARKPKKKSTIETDRGRIERHIKPLLGKKRIRDITREDVQAFVFDVASGKTAANVKTKSRGRAIVEGGRGTATRTVGLLGGILSHAVKRGLIPENPARGVERFSDGHRERFLSAVELKLLGDALTAAESAWQEHEERRAKWIAKGKVGPAPKVPAIAEDPLAVAAFRLLVLTGARKSEIQALRWEWVNIERQFLRLPDSKTDVKIIPLGAPAVELLTNHPHFGKNPHVFPGQKAGGHLVGLQKIWERIRKCAKLPDVRLHDLRHSFASVGASGGDSLLMIGAILGHRDVRTTQRYAHLSDNPVKATARRISNEISAAMGGNSAVVVTLDKKGNQRG